MVAEAEMEGLARAGKGLSYKGAIAILCCCIVVCVSGENVARELDMQQVVLDRIHASYEIMLSESNQFGAEAYLSPYDHRIGNHNFKTYSQNIILDPCRGHPADCCMERFGSPEYVREAFPSSAGWIWASAAADAELYKCQLPCIGKWTKVASEQTFQQLDADESSLWALDILGTSIAYRQLDGSGEWNFISGEFEQISASGTFAVLGIEKETRNLLFCYKPCSGKWVKPVENEKHPLAGSPFTLPPQGDLLRVDADSTHVYAATTDGRLFVRRYRIGEGDSRQWADIEDGDWIDVTPTAVNVTHVTVSVAGVSLWTLTTDGVVFGCVKPCLGGVWMETPLPPGGPFRSLDAGEDLLYAVSAIGGQVYHRSTIVSPSFGWLTVPASSDQSSETLSAWASLPDGGFTSITISSNPSRSSQVSDFYTVRDNALSCSNLNEARCISNAEIGCVWSADLGKCEAVVPITERRLMDEHVVFDDPNCVVLEVIQADGSVVRQPGYARVQQKEGEELTIQVDPTCVEHGVRRRLPEARPVCWDHNETVRADTGCRDGNGEAHDYCFAVAYSSTAIIPQCGNEWKHDPECGSFLEVHRGDPMKPFFKGSLDTRMITKSRIPLDTLFTNGFKTMVVSTLFETNQDTVYSFNFDPADNRTRVLCAGDYQLWWTQVIRGRRIVEFIKKFRVIEPSCDWDSEANDYLEYHVVQ